MLQGDRSFLRVLHEDLLLLNAADPLGELQVVGHCSGEHDDADVVGQLDDDLLPDRASLLIVDIVDLVENDPFDICDS